MHAPVIIEAFDPVDDVELGKRTGVVTKQMGALDLHAGYGLVCDPERPRGKSFCDLANGSEGKVGFNT